MAVFVFTGVRQMRAPAGRGGVNLGVLAGLGNIPDRKFLNPQTISCSSLQPSLPSTQNGSQDMDTPCNKILTVPSGPSSFWPAALLRPPCPPFPKVSSRSQLVSPETVPWSNTCVKHWVKQSYAETCTYGNSQMLSHMNVHCEMLTGGFQDSNISQII